MFRAFRHAPFRSLWTVVILCQLGFWFSTVSFQWVVAHRTDNDPLALGVLYFCTLAPFLLLSLPAGVLADTRDRRRLLTATQICAVGLAVTAALLAALADLPIPVVMPLAFLAGTVIVFVSTTSQALTANVVPLEDLSSAVPLHAAGINIARITGPALAGPVILLGGPTSAFGLYAGFAVLVALLTAGVAVKRTVTRARMMEPILRRLSGGFRHARERHPAIPALLIVAATSVFGSSYMGQIPVLAAQVSSDSDRAYLVLMTLSGLGALVGVLLVARRGLPVTLTPALAQLIVLGAVVTAIGVTATFPLMAGLIVLGGGLTFSIMNSINSLLQHLVDDEQRGRVLSLYFVGWGGLLPLGGLALGALVRVLGVGGAFALYGGLAIVSAVGILLVLRRPAPGGLDATPEPS